MGETRALSLGVPVRISHRKPVHRLERPSRICRCHRPLRMVVFTYSGGVGPADWLHHARRETLRRHVSRATRMVHATASRCPECHTARHALSRSIGSRVSLAFCLDVEDDWPPVAVESVPFQIAPEGYVA